MIQLGHFLPGGEILKEEKGVSETYIGIIEIGDKRLNAYVKFLSDRELANELLGSVLATYAGLPTPDAFLVRVGRNDYPASPRFQTDPNLTAICAFASSAVSLKSLNRRADLRSPDARRAFVAAWHDWADVIGFDDWIANGDRHGGNFLIGEKGQVWLIDHGHSFTGPNWRGDKLDPAIIVNCRLWNDLLRPYVKDDEKKPAAGRVRGRVEKFKAIDARSAVGMSRISTFLDETDQECVSNFLTKRPSTIMMRICSVLGIPELHLGETP